MAIRIKKAKGSPVKAGKSATKKSGGIFTMKVVKIMKKAKKK